MEDQKGFLWFATDKGVSRFDGNTFSTFDVSDGLSNNSVISLCFYNKDLFLGCLYGLSEITEKQVLKSIKLSEPELFKNSNIVFNNGYLYSTGQKNTTVIYQLKSKHIVTNETQVDESFNNVYSICRTNAGEVLEGRELGLYAYVKDTQRVKLKIPLLENKRIRQIHDTKNGNLLVATDKLIYLFREKFVLIDSIALPEEIRNTNLKVCSSVNGVVWIANEEGKVYRVSKTGTNWVFKNISTLFSSKKVSINNIYADSKGNLWISTYNNGVYCVYNSYSNHYTDIDGLDGAFITDIFVDSSENIFVASHKGFFIKRKDAAFKKITTISNYTYRLVPDGKRIIGCKVSPSPKSVSLNKVIHSPYTCLMLMDARRAYVGKDLIAYAQWDGILRFKNKRDSVLRQVRLTPKEFGCRITKIYSKNEQEFWIGTTEGLLYYNYKTDQVKKINQVTSVLTDIIDGPKNTLLVAAENGLYVWKDSIWTFIREFKGKKIANLSALAIDHNNRLWVATNNGVLIANDQNYFYEMKGYPHLLSNEVTCLYYDAVHNRMYIGSNLGVTLIDMDALDAFYKTPPDVNILTVTTKDSNTFNPATVYISYKNKYATIEYTAVNYTTPKSISFRYRMNDGVWKHTKNRTINLLDLAGGENIFYIESSLDEVHWGKTSTITFYVSKPYYQRTGVQVVIALLVLLIFLAVYRMGVNRIHSSNRKKLALRQQLDDLRYQALNSSVNPHFIFNVLGSIQSYITGNNPFDASDYIAKFARLIRITLHHANKRTIVLEEEISRISIYLELEKLRCGNKLTYQIEISDQVDLKAKIPNMIIQPLIENAIIHGVLNLPDSDTGQVYVGIFKEEGLLRIVVDDNGVGYNKETTSKHGYESIGLTNLEQRLALMKNTGSTFSIKNNAELDSSQSGTIAEIRIPL